MTFEPVLAAARLGEAWAFERLFELVSRRLVNYLRAQGVEDPDDLSNEVLLRAFRSLDRFEGNEDRFRAWLFTIAHHAVIDDRRRRARRPMTTDLDNRLGPVGDAEDDALESLSRQRVIGLLDALAPDQRDVLVARFVADLSIEDTATGTGKSIAAVKALQRRGLANLRREISTQVVSR